MEWISLKEFYPLERQMVLIANATEITMGYWYDANAEMTRAFPMRSHFYQGVRFAWRNWRDEGIVDVKYGVDFKPLFWVLVDDAAGFIPPAWKE